MGSQIPPPGGRTFYVGLSGNDSNSDVQAESAQTPWKTFFRALQSVNPADTLLILPGLYASKLESVHDGTAGAPINIRAANPGTVTIQPPSGSGVYIGHHYHTVEGLVVTGGSIGLQMGPYKQTSGSVTGLIVRHNEVTSNGVGIKFTSVVTATAAHNVVTNNGKEGIAHVWDPDNSPTYLCPPGTGATLFQFINDGLHGYTVAVRRAQEAKLRAAMPQMLQAGSSAHIGAQRSSKAPHRFDACLPGFFCFTVNTTD